MSKSRKDKGRTPNPNVSIGGVSEPEYVRQQKLPRRQLMASDIPTEPWDDAYARYLLRADGVIEALGFSVPMGEVRPDGGVAWYRM